MLVFADEQYFEPDRDHLAEVLEVEPK